MVCMLAADADTSMLAASTEGFAGWTALAAPHAGLPEEIHILHTFRLLLRSDPSRPPNDCNTCLQT